MPPRTKRLGRRRCVVRSARVLALALVVAVAWTAESAVAADASGNGATDPGTLTVVGGDSGIAPATGEEPAGSGSSEPGEPSAWDGVLGLLAWILVAAVALGALALALLGTELRRSRDRAAPPRRRALAPDPGPVAAPELTVVTFAHPDGAGRALADVRSRGAPALWMRDVAFVEGRRHGRVVVRGTFAGHSVDVEDVRDAVGHGSVEGRIAVAIVGLAFGREASAARLIAEGAAGDERDGARAVDRRAALLAELCAGVPGDSSAIVSLGGPGDADALVAALHDRPSQVIRRRLSPADATGLAGAAAPAPSPAP
jgi:hypothetical protein